jgi:4-amino-4-deoxy-L-arabinose transferase-like glycosyltransferase
MSRRDAILIVLGAALLPRLALMLYERDALIAGLTEKSDRFARTLVASGTYGFIAGRPSANTQPLYGFLLSGIYWVAGRDWTTVATAQTLLAAATALLVYAIGAHIGGRAVGVVGAVVSTLHPYLVWHDIHINREVLDGTLAAGLTLAVLVAAERRTLRTSAVAGVVAGLAVLANSRLVLLPLALGVFVAWEIRPLRRAALAAVMLVAVSFVVTLPWLVRNEASVGCFTLTTDARALWKANTPETYGILASGKWLDQVPNLRGAPPWPERAADITERTGTVVTVDECAQMRLYQHETTRFWREHPGEKARLAAQAVRMLWSPFVTVESDTPQTGIGGFARRIVEPLYFIALAILALIGMWRLPRRYLVLTLLLLAYGTVMAMVFAGTVRYRVPWDFLLCIPAAFVLTRTRVPARAPTRDDAEVEPRAAS